MKTKTITPELKEQFKAIFLDARESSVKHHKRAIGFRDKMNDVRSDIMGYRDALSSTYDLAFRLSEFSCLIASSLSENLIASKRMGSLTENTISKSFELIKLLIDVACSKEDIEILCSHYHNKVNLIESVDIDDLDEYIDTLFKD